MENKRFYRAEYHFRITPNRLPLLFLDINSEDVVVKEYEIIDETTHTYKCKCTTDFLDIRIKYKNSKSYNLSNTKEEALIHLLERCRASYRYALKDYTIAKQRLKFVFDKLNSMEITAKTDPFNTVRHAENHK